MTQAGFVADWSDGRTARLRAVVEAVVDFAAYGVGAPFRATTVQQDTQKPCETVRTSERRNPRVSGVFARNPLVGATPNTYPAYRPAHQHHRRQASNHKGFRLSAVGHVDAVQRLCNRNSERALDGGTC